jgi:hypothetical protein
VPPIDPSTFFQTRGGSLGSALAGGVGLACRNLGYRRLIVDAARSRWQVADGYRP